MFFIDALNLINLCVEHNILHTEEGFVLIQHENGPVLWEKELLAQSLMRDFEGQDALLAELEKKNIPFEPFDFGPIDNAIAMFGPKGKTPEPAHDTFVVVSKDIHAKFEHTTLNQAVRKFHAFHPGEAIDSVYKEIPKELYAHIIHQQEELNHGI